MDEPNSIWFWVSPDDADRAIAALADAGLTSGEQGSRPDLVVIYAHGGPGVGDRAAEVLEAAGIAAQRQESAGTPIGGVSPANRWMEPGFRSS